MKKSRIKELLKYKYLYIMLFPVVVYYLVVYYFPYYGIQLAFKEFWYNKGIQGSPWIGLDNFKEIFRLSDFWNSFFNTIKIGLGRIIFEFPVPIILAIIINSVRQNRVKRFFQTLYTFPHFLSWIIVAGIVTNYLSSEGAVNQIITALGGSKTAFLTTPRLFVPIIFITNIWKEVGWNAVIYIAAIAGINPELYEAAIVDGATRFQQTIHVTWPGIRSTAAILLVLCAGCMMNNGFEQIFNLYNPTVYDVSDIIDTYVYRRTFSAGMTFGTSTAVGLFKSIVSCILIYVTNRGVKLLGEEGLV